MTRAPALRHVRNCLGLTCLSLVLGAARCGGDAQPVPSDGWKLVWSDEFDGPALQKPDPAKWGYDVGGDGWGNAQLEYDTDRPENVSLDGNGHLAITARKESWNGRDYTSARILTKKKFEQLHGKISARLQVPVGAGMWPAFWMLGNDIDQVSWPQCGEIDLLETRGQEPGILHGSLHGPGYSGVAAKTQAFTLPNGQGFNSSFHTVAIEWDPNKIVFFVDDVAYHTVTSDEVLAGSWVFEHPFFLLLNLAVGGNFLGPPDTYTPFPNAFLIDWVRVYERAP